MLRVAFLVLLALPLAACSPGTPIRAQGSLPSPADSIEDVAARSAVVDFLEAYERAPTDGGTALSALAGSPPVQHWAAWLAVQYQQAGGTVAADHVLRAIGPMQPLTMSDGSDARFVQVAAEMRFRITPSDGQVREQVRSLDGGMVLVRDAMEGWKVADFTRDGVPISNSVHVFPLGTGVQERGVTISLDSFILDRDQWAIGVVVRNDTDRTIGVEPEFVGVYDVTAAPVDVGIAPDSLSSIDPGEDVQALVAYPIPEGEEVSGLRLVVGTRIPGDERLVFLDVPVRPVLRTLERAGSSSASPSPAGSA
jgi:hypothetical protein